MSQEKNFCGLCGGASKGEHASDCPTPEAQALVKKEREEALCARLLEAAKLACQLELGPSVFAKLAAKAYQQEEQG